MSSNLAELSNIDHQEESLDEPNQEEASWLDMFDSKHPSNMLNIFSVSSPEYDDKIKELIADEKQRYFEETCLLFHPNLLPFEKFIKKSSLDNVFWSFSYLSKPIKTRSNENLNVYDNPKEIKIVYSFTTSWYHDYWIPENVLYFNALKGVFESYGFTMTYSCGTVDDSSGYVIRCVKKKI
jgi:hypothetical protein